MFKIIFHRIERRRSTILDAEEEFVSYATGHGERTKKMTSCSTGESKWSRSVCAYPPVIITKSPSLSCNGSPTPSISIQHWPLVM